MVKKAQVHLYHEQQLSNWKNILTHDLDGSLRNHAGVRGAGAGSQSKNAAYSIIWFIWHPWNKKNYRDGEQISSCQWFRDWRCFCKEGALRSLVVMGSFVSSLLYKNLHFIKLHRIKHTHTHTRQCIKTDEIWIKVVNCTKIYFLPLVLYLRYERCYHWSRLGEMHTKICVHIFCNFLLIYHFFKIKS